MIKSAIEDLSQTMQKIVEAMAKANPSTGSTGSPQDSSGQATDNGEKKEGGNEPKDAEFKEGGEAPKT